MLNKKYLPLIALVTLLAVTTVAVVSVTHEYKGKYVPVRIGVTPISFDLGNVTSGDIRTYTIALENKSPFTVSVTYASSSPGWVIGVVEGWDAATYRTLQPKQIITVTVRVQIGDPPNPDVEQDFTGTLLFYGNKV